MCEILGLRHIQHEAIGQRKHSHSMEDVSRAKSR
jgi:hypothetical protein